MMKLINGSVQVGDFDTNRIFVCLFCCFTSQVNSYGHGGTVSQIRKLTVYQSFTSLRQLLTFLRTEQTQIRQLLQELPDQGLLCLLMEPDQAALVRAN